MFRYAYGLYVQVVDGVTESRMLSYVSSEFVALSRLYVKHGFRVDVAREEGVPSLTDQQEVASVWSIVDVFEDAND